MPFYQFSFAFPNAGTAGALRKPRELTRRTTALLLLYGLTLLLIHLGDARVLTRHEAFAAQPGREMLNNGRFADWMLPKLAGAPREAKPPGMMWLIAASIYIFRTSAAWAARFPSAMAAMAVALMIAHLAARWFGDRIGRLAGLLQVSFSYIILQAKLSEADMSLVAAVGAALCLFARGTIDSPFGKATGWRARLTFWLACGAAFLLKGPIGLIFVLLTIVTFLFVRRRHGERDWQPLWWLANPLGIACFIILVVIWPLVAWRLDPTIVQVWHSEMAGTANG
jgi:4-amino-4-deoxy-L-arabinose transferase-like glycosyltransferase